jgi:hypothetical protein
MKTFKQVNEGVSTDLADDLLTIKMDFIDLWKDRISKDPVFQKNKSIGNKSFVAVTSELEKIIEMLYGDK